MALTRRMLKGMGLTEEQVDTIIEAHTETVDGLKADLAKYKADAEALPDIRKQLETAQADLEAERKDSWKVKYEGMKADFEAYKEAEAQKAAHTAKTAAYENLLKQAGVSEKRLQSVLKVSDVDSIELDENGAVKGADKLTEGIRAEWADFIPQAQASGAATATPAANGGTKTITKAEIMAVKDAAERQRLIAENRELFKKG